MSAAVPALNSARTSGPTAEALLNLLPGGLLVLGLQAEVVRINQQAMVWWGVPPAALGQSLGQVGAGYLPIAAFAALQQAATGQFGQGRYWLPAAGGWVTLTALPQPTGEVVVYWQLELAADTTRQQAYLLHLSDALAPLTDAGAVRQTAIEVALEFFGADRCCYCELSGSQISIRHDATSEAQASVAGTYDLARWPQVQASLERGQPVVVPDVRTTDLLDEALRQAGGHAEIMAFLGVPVRQAGRLVGVLCLTQRTPRAWTPQEVTQAAETAERIRAAVVRAQAEATRHQLEEELRLLVTAGSVVVYRMSADWRQLQLLPGRDLLTRATAPRPDWLAAYIPPADRAAVTTAVRSAIANKRFFELEHRVFRADRSVGWTHSRAVPVFDAQGELTEWLGTATDITLRKRAESVLQASQARQTFLLQLADALRPLADPLAIQEAAVQLLGQHLGVNRALYLEVQPDLDTLRLGPAYTRHVPTLPTVLRLADFGDFMSARYQAGETVVTNDVLADAHYGPELHAAFAAIRVRAAIGVPLRKNGQLLAVLSVQQAGPRRWGKPEIALVEEVAERTWAAVERARAEQSLAASEAKYRTLFDSIDEGVACLELLLNEEGRPVDWVYLEHNPALTRLTGLAQDIIGKKASDIYRNLEPFWMETFSRVVRTGQAERVEYSVAELGNQWFDVYAARVGGAGSQQLVIVYNNITERKQQQQRQEFLLTLSDTLRAETGVAAVGNRAVQLLAEQLRADRVYLVTLSPDDDTVTVTHEARSADLPPLQGTYRSSDFPAAIKEIFERTIIYQDVRTDARLTELDRLSFAGLGAVGFIAAPIRRGSEAMIWAAGALSTQPRAWTAAEVALFEDAVERTWAAVERARAEQALRKSEERLRIALEAAELGTWDWDLPADEVRWNSRHYQQLGLAPSDEILHPADFFRFVHPADQAQVQQHLAAAVAGPQAFAAEFRVLTAQGEERWMSGHGQATERDATGRARRISGVMLDVTARKHAEQALQELAASLERKVARRTQDLQRSRDLLQSVYDTTLIGLAVLEALPAPDGSIPDFRLVSVNHKLHQELGYADLVGRTCHELFPTAEPDGLLELMRQAVGTSQPQQTEYYYGYGGAQRWFALLFVRLDGNGVVATVLDITERKLAEQELLKNLQLLEQAEQVGQLGSWEYEPAPGALRWSRGMYRLFGLAPGAPVGPAIYLDYVAPADRPVAERLVQALTAADAAFTETLRLQVGGDERTVRVKAVLMRGDADRPRRLLGVDLDISQVQRLEADNLRLRLSQQQALFEAVQNAQEEERRRISESLHNGLGQLLYATKLQLDRLPPLPEEPARREAARLLGDAIRQTRALSHELTPALLEEFGLEAAVGRICRTLSTPALHWRCHLVFDEGPALPVPLQLAVYRLAQELAQNVVKHAQATEGTLEVEVLPAWVVLRVEDNGQGFDPARTSDGLGLRTLRSRVALLGGSVHLDAAPGQGTTCQIRLPLTPTP